MSLSLILLVTIFNFFAGGAAASSCDVDPTVTIDSGVVIGITTSLSDASVTVDKFLGIPFAASPTRFAPAATHTAWTSPYYASQFGYACVEQWAPENEEFAMTAWLNYLVQIRAKIACI